MKLFTDLLPVLVFFVVYKFRGIYEATAAAIALALVQSLWLWLRHRRLETMQLVTLGLLVFFGSATLLLQDPVFIQWKPTVVQWLLALLFLATRYLGHTPLIKRLFDKLFVMPEPKWHQLNLAWVAFFLVSGGLNLAVAYTFDENTWVNFKLFGLTGLTLLFGIAQVYWLSEYLHQEEQPPA